MLPQIIQNIVPTPGKSEFKEVDYEEFQHNGTQKFKVKLQKTISFDYNVKVVDDIEKYLQNCNKPVCYNKTPAKSIKACPNQSIFEMTAYDTDEKTEDKSLLSQNECDVNINLQPPQELSFSSQNTEDFLKSCYYEKDYVNNPQKHDFSNSRVNKKLEKMRILDLAKITECNSSREISCADFNMVPKKSNFSRKNNSKSQPYNLTKSISSEMNTLFKNHSDNEFINLLESYPELLDVIKENFPGDSRDQVKMNFLISIIEEQNEVVKLSGLSEPCDDKKFNRSKFSNGSSSRRKRSPSPSTITKEEVEAKLEKHNKDFDEIKCKSLAQIVDIQRMLDKAELIKTADKILYTNSLLVPYKFPDCDKYDEEKSIGNYSTNIPDYDKSSHINDSTQKINQNNQFTDKIYKEANLRFTLENYSEQKSVQSEQGASFIEEEKSLDVSIEGSPVSIREISFRSKNSKNERSCGMISFGNSASMKKPRIDPMSVKKRISTDEEIRTLQEKSEDFQTEKIFENSTKQRTEKYEIHTNDEKKYGNNHDCSRQLSKEFTPVKIIQDHKEEPIKITEQNTNKSQQHKPDSRKLEAAELFSTQKSFSSQMKKDLDLRKNKLRNRSTIKPNENLKQSGLSTFSMGLDCSNLLEDFSDMQARFSETVQDTKKKCEYFKDKSSKKKSEQESSNDHAASKNYLEPLPANQEQIDF